MFVFILVNIYHLFLSFVLTHPGVNNSEGLAGIIFLAGCDVLIIDPAER